MSEIDFLKAELKKIALAARLPETATTDQIAERIKLLFEEIETLVKDSK